MLDKNTVKLLRIPFSILLMPVFLLAWSQVNTPYSWLDVFMPFIILHLLIYPASNGYNSYVDRDEGSIGGLEKPPMPTENLFYVTLILDIIALLSAFLFVNTAFFACLLLCVLASRAYSARQIRLKKYPILGFVVVAVLQGGFTYYISFLSITHSLPTLNETNLWILAACTFQIAGVYPVTLAEVLSRFGGGTAQRQAVAGRLVRIYQLAVSTGFLARFVVFGSFVTAKPEPRDVDVILVMEDGAIVEQGTHAQLVKKGVQVSVQSGAGLDASFLDEAYQKAGATIVPDARIENVGGSRRGNDANARHDRRISASVDGAGEMLVQ